MPYTLQGTINQDNNIKWGTVRINNNKIPGTDNSIPTIQQGTVQDRY